MKGSQSLRAVVCCALFILTTGSTIHAQQLWEPVNGPYIGRVFSLCVDGNNTILAGTERGGVYSSSDAGTVWAYSGLAYEVVRTLYRHSDGIVYAGLQNGMMVSHDNGGTWTMGNFSTSNNGFGIGITSTGVQFVGGWGGLDRSTDQGATFEKMTLTPFGSRVDEICIGPNDAVFVGLYQGGLIRSVDNGQTWTLADPLFESKTVDAVISKGGMMFAGVQGLNILRSSAAAATWVPSSNPNSGVSALYARTERQLWAGTETGQILSSTDGAETWTTQFVIPGGWPVSSIIETSDGNLLAGTQWGGVYKSSDDGVTWTQSNQGLSNLIPTSAKAFVLDSRDNLYLSYTAGSVVKSSDAGGSWTEIGSKDDYVNCLAIGPGDVLYTASRYLSVWHTSDDGATWVPDTTGLPQFTPNALDVNPQGEIAVGGSDGKLYVMETGSSAWRDAMDVRITSTINCLLWANGALFAGTDGKGLFRSLDKGMTWTKLVNGMNLDNVYACYSDRQGGIFVGGWGSIFTSTDNGDSWIDIGDGSSFSVSSIVKGPGGMIYASTSTKGVFMADGQAGSWTTINSGLQNLHVSTLLLDGNGTLFASTYGNGIFRATAPVASVNDPTAVAAGAELRAAHPNPLTASTRITYALRAAAYVRIAVYDMTGREISLLVDELRPAGVSDIGFKAAGLSPGMYFCLMHTGAQVLAQPLMLLR
ncbi:MAG: hypothetical protein WC824_06700 [Bacteroidota bacterium]